VDPAVLHGLDAVGDLEELAGRGFRIRVGRSWVSFITMESFERQG
jgi:hypothetical protein